MEDNKLCLEKQPLSDELLNKMNAYWRAANYLSAGQLYLLDNPLLKKPLTMDQIKKKIVGHWGTVPGQNFIYVHCNRVIKRYDLDMILLSGPGHGGNFLIANTYLEGSYSEVYPNISQDEEGMKKMFKQFSFPCGVPSHCAPETPGSINEGGELGYSIAHGFGAVLDNPDLIATVVVGDGEAETGPLATSWQSNKFLNPITDGAVLPILHLNGYKISNPTIFSRISHEEVENFFKGCGWKPYFVEGDDPMTMHRKMAETMDACIEEIKAIQKNARENNDPTRPFWPMIVLRTPKGWTGPKVVDGLQIEGSFRAHQVPLSMESPEHLDLLKEWLESYHAEELFDEKGRLIPELAELAPKGDARLGASGRADGGCVMRGNDVLQASPDIMVTDSLTGNIMVKMLSSFTTGGSFEATGFGYGPGIGEGYEQLVMIVSRASGAPVIANAIRYAAQLVRGKVFEVAKEEFAAVKKAGLKEILDEHKASQKPAAAEEEVKEPPKEVVTAQIPGIEVMDLEDAVKVLWKLGIYAESGMGCTGPIIRVSDANLAKAEEELKKSGYIN